MKEVVLKSTRTFIHWLIWKSLLYTDTYPKEMLFLYNIPALTC